jgi:hypothetical protein
MITLAVWEQIIGPSGVAARIEALPIGVRRRQVTVRAQLAGMCPPRPITSPRT